MYPFLILYFDLLLTLSFQRVLKCCKKLSITQQSVLPVLPLTSLRMPVDAVPSLHTRLEKLSVVQEGCFSGQKVPASPPGRSDALLAYTLAQILGRVAVRSHCYCL